MQQSIVDYSKTQIMLETTRTREVNIGWNFVHIWKSYIDPTCWICEKQTSISLSTTESEIISFDAGLNVWTEHPHTAFLSHICTLSSLCTHHIVAQGVARRVCMKHVHPHVISCLSVCCFLVLSSSTLSRASTFFLLLVLCPELRLP